MLCVLIQRTVLWNVEKCISSQPALFVSIEPTLLGVRPRGEFVTFRPLKSVLNLLSEWCASRITPC